MSETPTMTETFALSGAGNLFKQEDFDFCAQMEAKLAAMTAAKELAERRLAEEITWGHRFCTPDNCVSSGTDCPAHAEAEKEGVTG